VVGRIEQIRKPDPKYQVGKGKVRELAQLVKETDAEKIIFDNFLKKETGVEAIDRFQLILEIFARRASTTEAKLQIELARLKRELTWAKEKVRLAKMGEQPGFMGLGAYEVDVYYETIKRQIYTSLHRARRLELGFSSISLAGYTNAGKSSLFAALTREQVPIDNALFTTLSTTTRLIDLYGRKVLLIDTVGFIDRLPLTLIEAFHSTLEETIFSDLILLVVDVSEPIQEIERKLTCCLDTIHKIGASGIPIVTALNKIDLTSEEELEKRMEALKELAPNPVPISALYGTNLDALKYELRKQLKNYVQVSLSLPMNSETMSFVSWLFNNTNVYTVKYEGDQVNLVFEAVPWFADKICGQVKRMNGSFNKIVVRSD